LEIHCAWASEAPRSTRIAGMAMARIEPSMKPSAEASIAATSTKRRCEGEQNAPFGVGLILGMAASLGGGMGAAPRA